MTRIDRVILGRLTSRVLLTIAVVAGLIMLTESLNVWRFQRLASIGGPMLGIAAIVVDSARWVLSTLPVTLLIGAIIGLLDLQARREMTVVKAAGTSVWRLLRAPIAAVVLLGVIAAFGADTLIVSMSRMLGINSPQSSEQGDLWLEQRGDGERYVVHAARASAGGTSLEGAVVFLSEAAGGQRLHADQLQLRDGHWYSPSALRFSPDEPPHRIDDLELETTTTAADMGVKLQSANEFTVFELWDALTHGISDPTLRARVEMRLARLLSLPLVLIGSVLIAFAFTAGYRRTNKYGGAVLYGIVLGFVIYVLTEMAAMAGAAGVLGPIFASVAPAVVAIVIGATVLLFREDGRI